MQQQDLDAIDFADGISARLENLRCLTDSLCAEVEQSVSAANAVGELSLMRGELDRVLELTEALSHRLLGNQAAMGIAPQS